MAERPDPGRGLANAIGVEYLDFDPDHAAARMPVAEVILQPFGIVHGGALAALAESLCSRATYERVADDGMAAMGQANDVSFLRPISAGTVHALATARHRGRSTWVWDCEISDDDGRLCALARLTIAIRPARHR